MELRQVKSFVTVADTLNFTRASEVLFITQSTLSKQIFSLEEDLNVKLLERDTHSVLLTDTGMAFLVEARRLLSLADRAVEAARSGNIKKSDARLIIGYDKRLDVTSSLTGAYMKLFSTFHREHPAVDVQIRDLESTDLVRALLNRTVDIAVMLHEGRVVQALLDIMINTRPITNDEFVFLLPRQEGVDYSNANLRDLLSASKNAYIPRHHAAFSTASEIFRTIDIYPYIQFCDSWVDILMKVSRGDGFTFCPGEQYAALDLQDIVGLSYPQGCFVASVMVHWEKNNTNQYVQEFLKNITDNSDNRLDHQLVMV